MIKDRRFLKEKTPEAAPQPAAVRLADVINVDGLHGELADPQPSLPHDIISGHTGFPGGTSDFLRADGLFAPPPSPPAVFNPSGTGFRHVTAGAEDAAAKLVEDADVDPAAAIVESKLSLNFPTHSNALDHSNVNDPTAGEKAALPGTNGVVGAGNKYVTDSDPRNSDSRTPLAHKASHENGGSDEINVGGLSGLLADPQTPDLTAAAGKGIVISASTINFAQSANYTPGAIPFPTSTTAIGFDAANLGWDNATKVLSAKNLTVNGLSTFNVPALGAVFNSTGLGGSIIELRRVGALKGTLSWDSSGFAIASTGTLLISATGGISISGLTEGSVLFAGAGGLLLQDNANLFWDNALKKLQVESLEVNGILSSNFTSPVGGVFDSALGGSSFSFQELAVQSGALSWDATQIVLLSDSNLVLLAGTQLSLYSGATPRWYLPTAGHFLATTDNTLDIGAAGATRPRSLYLGTSLFTPALTVSGLTAGSVLFAGTGGLISQDNANLFWNDTNNRLGIATNAPLSSLGVLGNASIGATYGVIAAPTSGLIVEGAVGIGKSAPAAGNILEIVGKFTFNIPAGAGGVVNCTAASDCRIDFQRQTVRAGGFGWDTAQIQLFSDGELLLNAATQLVLYSNSVSRWHLPTAGHLLATTDNLLDIGDATHRPSNVYAASKVITPQIQFPSTEVPSSDPNNFDGYKEAQWTPIDSSGAGLSFTVVAADCNYRKYASMIVANFRLVYPATANAAGAVIGGLPFTSINSDGMGGFPTYQSSLLNMMFAMAANGTYFAIFKNDGNQFANSALSGMDIRGTIIYFCT